jgi:hypothetical protein
MEWPKWYSTCSASSRPRVQPPVLGKKKKESSGEVITQNNKKFRAALGQTCYCFPDYFIH